jgi:hypothetical protein
MSREMIVRFVPGYGYLPIVREFDPMAGTPGKELYRGEFRPTAIEAACVCQPFMEAAQ